MTMPNQDIRDRHALAETIAQEAGQVAFDYFSRRETLVIETKGDQQDVVSIADREVENLIKARVSAAFPDDGFLGEEFGLVAGSSGYTWVVDPIDGTRDYLRGRPGWAVSVALIEDGRPVLGVLDAPARGERWTASLGGGAWRNGAAIRVTPRDTIVGARVPADQLPRRDHDLVPVPKPNSIALRIAMVAAGEADLVATMRWGHEWDIAAAVLLAGEAGATVTDALGAPLAFNTASAEAFGVLVTPPGIHAAAVERLTAYAAIAERVGAR